MHGGKSLKGVAAPSFRHGRYSKYLPPALAARYKRACNDPELLSLRSEIVALDAFTCTEMESLEDMPAGWRASLRQRAESIVSQQNRIAKLDHERVEFIEGRNTVNLSINALIKDIISAEPDPSTQRAARDRIIELFDKRRRLVESERKRLIELQQQVTIEEMMVVSNALLQAVKNNVPDRRQMYLIQQGFAAILGFPNTESTGNGASADKT